MEVHICSSSEVRVFPVKDTISVCYAKFIIFPNRRKKPRDEAVLGQKNRENYASQVKENFQIKRTEKKLNLNNFYENCKP